MHARGPFAHHRQRACRKKIVRHRLLWTGHTHWQLIGPGHRRRIERCLWLARGIHGGRHSRFDIGRFSALHIAGAPQG